MVVAFRRSDSVLERTLIIHNLKAVHLAIALALVAAIVASRAMSPCLLRCILQIQTLEIQSHFLYCNFKFIVQANPIFLPVRSSAA